LKVTPMDENTLRSRPSQLGQSVSVASVKAWWMSKADSHCVQR
jgi:hypothetical protein